ncbi:MAG: hypothetical protein V4727_10930 [Verrucomicrobiota bacterium]
MFILILSIVAIRKIQKSFEDVHFMPGSLFVETSPTLASLLRVADALGADLAKLIKSAGN